MKKVDSSLAPVLVRTELGKKSPLTPWPSKSCDSGGIEGFAIRLSVRHFTSRAAHADPPTSTARIRNAAYRNTAERAGRTLFPERIAAYVVTKIRVPSPQRNM